MNIRNLFEQLRDHPWLGHALLAICAILLIYAVLTVHDLNTKIATQCAQLSARVQRQAEIASQSKWLERRKNVTSQLVQLRSQLWQAPTPALAQANLRDNLSALIRENSLSASRLQVGQLSSVPDANIKRIKAQLRFKFEPAKLLTMLEKLEQKKPRVVVREADFYDRPGSRVKLGLVFYFRSNT